MKLYIPVIAAVIAGIFAIVSAFMVWKLKNSSDERRDQSSHNKEKYEEAKSLFTTTFQLFEEAMRQVLNRDKFTLSQEFSENNAKIHLLASQDIIYQYSEVASLLESWSVLHANASPRQMKYGDQTVTMIQAPDVTAQYKEPAKAEYEKLQDALQRLVELMRKELRGHA